MPFKKTITDDKADRNLAKKLKREMSGILNFALEGLQRMRSQGTKFSQSASCEKALDMYFSDLDPMYLFVKDCIIPSKGSKMTNKDIFSQYEGWLNQEGGTNKYDRITFSHEFKKALSVHKIPFTIGKTTGGERCIKGIAMKNGKQYFKNYTKSNGTDDIDEIID